MRAFLFIPFYHVRFKFMTACNNYTSPQFTLPPPPFQTICNPQESVCDKYCITEAIFVALLPQVFSLILSD